jgi:putative sigma-54 modulation protein
MKVSYRGVQQALPQKLQEKLDAKFGKLSKLLEKRGEKEAHVVLTTERHLHNAEITLQFYDHQLVGLGSDGDAFTALYSALEKLEKQAVKTRAKWREIRRHNVVEPIEAKTDAKAPKQKPVQAAKVAASGPAKSVYRVNHLNRRKPMTLDEAVMEMEGGRDYMVYRDAVRECISVLVRRRDGNFDLIEAA